MNNNFLKLAISLTLLFILAYPKSVEGIMLKSVPGNVSFPTVSLNGTPQETSGGTGSIKLYNIDLLIPEDWRMTVQATQFVQSGGIGLTLPLHSLSLKKPKPYEYIGILDISLGLLGVQYNGLIVGNGDSWIIDNEEPVVILQRASTGILIEVAGIEFKFPIDAFTLNLNPGTKMISEGSHSSTFTSTITWTLYNDIAL
ncbi:hypothetical protein [Bacillus sp. 1NLA3E]|uniref:hypothetical protein n=1 Tax=Bacillus sp. 1NLA3E TaxID=666686 RepID=UPI000247F3DB|nr:hypothetical protein [Bacillus sp. 1NLA3E]AGK53868.1 hypothetical protein B1NLA3E_10550 [Bacillus sp. 1NLA3E]